MSAMFRQRPPEVEAVQYQPTINCHEVYTFLDRPHDGLCQLDTVLEFPSWPGPGDGVARPGDWIVRGPDGEPFPVPAAEFAATYEQL